MNIAVLGSTKGTDLQYIIDAIESGSLIAEIGVVISNKEGSYILERARQHNIEAIFVSQKDKTREQFDKEIAALKRHHIRINYCCTDSSEEVTALFNSGVDFILTDQLSEMLEVAASAGIVPIKY